MRRALLLLPTVALAVGCGSARAEPAVRCPARAPQLHASTPATKHQRLVSPGASSLLLCRYAGSNAPHPLGLARSRPISNRATVASLVRRLNTLPPERGQFHCPFDDGSEILLVFGYPSGGQERITVGLRGCNAVSNGRTSTLAVSPAGRRLVRQVESLTRP